MIEVNARFKFQFARNLGITHSSPVASNPKKTTPVESAAAGRWYLITLGLALALIGGVFIALMARSYLRALEMRQWPQVRCVILSSEIEERRHDEYSAIEFRQKLSYGYEWKGKPYTGDRLSLRGNPWTSKRDLAEKRTAAYRKGMLTSCLVNPSSPEVAVLKPDSLAPGYSIWFPALFVVGGLGISVRALRNG